MVLGVYPNLNSCLVFTIISISSLSLNLAISQQIGEKCSSSSSSSDEGCGEGLYCLSCTVGLSGRRCVRSSATHIFNLLNNSLPFNKYAFLTTHNAFSINGDPPSHTGVPNIAPRNQEDDVAHQLNNGVRGLMLDVYDYKGDVWLCHSFGGHCHDYTAFGPALDTLKQIEAFLSANPSEIITIILEDYVRAPSGLTKVFTDAGLMKYWFPVSSMPRGGGDWPPVRDMVAKNHRLLVFTSVRAKEQSEGIAYQWNYMVENQYGDGGMKSGECPSRGESSPLNDTTKSLVLMNFFGSAPFEPAACLQNSGPLMDMLDTCHAAAANRWPNFLAVDFYKRSEGGGAFQAVDKLNGELLCGKDDVNSCVRL
ncbi:hypothetical protein DM860_008526 [Cuscuta australis]|uniref:Phosphatidylinositol-specific phospholipase C X domain-containing protein n=1 Tax=Cuscuta australis TaxID=267555 RepID=A0A328D8M5_9ASTE|nr:hypothetical protein DM860_008526 [Cuscuta australis]